MHQRAYDTLTLNVEEADLHIILHVFHAVRQGMHCVIVLSNDTDALVIFNFHKFLNANGLSELWMRKSASDTMPIHTLADKIDATKYILLAAHFIKESDVTSRIGTKPFTIKALSEKNIYLNLGSICLNLITPLGLQKNI